MVGEQLLEKDLRPSLYADVELALSELKPEFLDYQEWLQPTGHGNPRATYVSRNLKIISNKAVGKDRSHLKFAVSDGYITFDAIGFRMGYWLENIPKRVDLMYTFEFI